MQVTFKNEETFEQSVAFVKFDRSRRNKENAALHTSATLERARELFNQAKAAYCRSKVFLDINVKSVNVKVYKPSAADRLSEAVHAMNMSIDGTGIKMTEKLDKGVFSITYKIPA